MEIWKDITDFDGYQVSSYGRVRSKDRTINTANGRTIALKGKILSLQKNKKTGYISVKLGLYSKRQSVHLLVLKTFTRVPASNEEADHIDSDKTNNNLNNLRWLKIKDNRSKQGELNGSSKLSENDIRFIKTHYKSRCPQFGQNALARKFKVRQSLIWGIIHNLWWKHI